MKQFILTFLFLNIFLLGFCEVEEIWEEVKPIKTESRTIIEIGDLPFDFVKNKFNSIRKKDDKIIKLEENSVLVIADYFVAEGLRDILLNYRILRPKKRLEIYYNTSSENKHLLQDANYEAKPLIWKENNGNLTIPLIDGFRAKKIPLKKSVGPTLTETFTAKKELPIFFNTSKIDKDEIEQVLHKNNFFITNFNDERIEFSDADRITFIRGKIILRIVPLIKNRFGVTILPIIWVDVNGENKKFIIKSLAARVYLKNNEQFALGAVLYHLRNDYEIFFGKNFFDRKALNYVYDCFIKFSAY